MLFSELNGELTRSTDQQKPMVPPGKPLIAEPKLSVRSQPSAGGNKNLGASAGTISGEGVNGGGGVAAREAAAGISGGRTAGGAARVGAGNSGSGSNGAGSSEAEVNGVGSGGYGGGAVVAGGAGGADVGGGGGVGSGAGGDGSSNGGAGVAESALTSQVLFTFPLVPDVELLVMQEDVDFVQRIVVVSADGVKRDGGVSVQCPRG